MPFARSADTPASEAHDASATLPEPRWWRITARRYGPSVFLQAGPYRLLVLQPQAISFGNELSDVLVGVYLAKRLDATLSWVNTAGLPNRTILRLVADDLRIVPPGTRTTEVHGWLYSVATRLSLAAPIGRHGALLARRILAGLVEGALERRPATRRETMKAVRGWRKQLDHALGSAERDARADGHSPYAPSRVLAAARAERDWTVRKPGRSGLKLRTMYARAPVSLRLAPVDERAAAERAAALGIAESTALVTLHVRESGYRSRLGFVEREKERHRCSSIAGYAAAVEWLVARGYTVVRLGDATMTPVGWPGVVDLATSPLRTEELELWCVLRSAFFIGSDSGPAALPVLLNRPSLLANIAANPLLAYPLRSHDRFILKRAVERTTGRVLSLCEMSGEHYLGAGDRASRYEYLDNTPEDLTEAVAEMQAIVGDGPAAPTALQVAFRDRMYAAANAHRKTTFTPFLGDGHVGRAFVGRYFDS